MYTFTQFLNLILSLFALLILSTFLPFFIPIAIVMILLTPLFECYNTKTNNLKGHNEKR
jgi:hypothetical protein